MERLKSNGLKYLMAIVLLLMFSSVKFLLIPKLEDYEVFSYVFGGGLLLYGIFQTVIYGLELIFKMRQDSVVEIIISFLVLEILLYIFLQSSLVLSFFDRDDVDLFLLYQIVPVLVALLHRIYTKRLKRKDIRAM